VVSGLRVLLLVSALFPAVASGSSLDALREELLFRLNQEREEAGAPPLRLIPALTHAAQQHAVVVSFRRSERPEPGGTEAMVERLRQVGYVAYTWDESLVVSWGDARQIVQEWRSGDRRSNGMSPHFRDVGIGISEYRGVPLYTFLFGWHRGDVFARETAALRDLERVRAEMLARVNAARKSAGLPPLLRNLDLDRASQAHAQDLLTRAYYKHVSPEGATPVTRARAAGYPSDLVSENLHERTASVEQIVEDWLRSPLHRRNILDPGAQELGIGLALAPGYGLDAKDYRVVWVQSFGRRAGAVALAP